MAAVPSNEAALGSSRDFCCGSLSHVVLLGPSGCGKTTLLKAAADSYQSRWRTKGAFLVDACQWVEHAADFAPGQALLLDNAQVGLASLKMSTRLCVALERRVRSGSPTMLAMTCDQVPSEIRTVLPRFHAWRLAQIREPGPAERAHIVSHLAAQQGLHLSQPLLTIMAKRLSGSGRSLEGALKRLKLVGKQWSNDASTLRACGLLSPYFEDTGEWDFPSAISEGLPQVKHSERDDLMTYVMLRTACLHEAEVARYLELSPADCFSSARNHAKRVRQCAEVRSETEAAVSRLVSHLQRS